MTAIDFAILESGEQFEELCEDLFKTMGYNDPPPERSGRGPDGGRDLIVTEHRGSDIWGFPRRFRWLVECKNFAVSNKSVQTQDIGSIVEKLLLHKADGYLLVTTTIPSTTVESHIRAIDCNQRIPFEATYWAKSRLAEELLKHRCVCEKYFGTATPGVAALPHWSRFNPFLELLPYEEVQAKYFFGRETDVHSVVEMIYRNSLVLLYGESGVGKTSLIQAGILPVLRSEGFRVANVGMRSDFSALDLLNAVQLAVSDIPRSEGSNDSDDLTALAEPFQRLVELLCQCDQRLIVVLDQFETLFQSSPEVRANLGQFLSSAASLAHRYRSVTFLFGLRSDHLGNLGIWAKECQFPEIWYNSYPIQKLSASQAIQVLDKVPALVNAEFSRDALQAIVNGLQRLDNQQIYPPNLQIVASKVFDMARSHTDPQTDRLIIALEDYEAVGGTDGVLKSFFNEKMIELGSDRDLAHHVLLTLVSATGRRLSLSESELSERLSQTPEVLRPVLQRLFETRLVKPTDQPDAYELVHDVLAAKVLEATEDEQRKAKAAREAFELAVATWQTERVPESGPRLDWFYQYRHNLDIGVNELLFVLFSETESHSSPLDLFEIAAGSSDIRTRCIRWINQASPTACVEALNSVLKSSSDAETARTRESRVIPDRIVEKSGVDSEKVTQRRKFEIITCLCSAAHFEVQRELVTELEETKQHDERTLYRQAYVASPIPTQASLSYLQSIVRGDLQPYTRQAIAYRILEHYRREFPGSRFGRLAQTEERIQNWIAAFPTSLLCN